MKQETFDRIVKLRNNAAQINDLFDRKIPTWKADPKEYDKTRWGFVEGDSDGWFHEVRLFFQAWAGTYGNSSTYAQIRTDKDVFNEHFIKWLNANREMVMRGVAASIEKEASDLKAEAEKELAQQQQLLGTIQ